MSGPLIVARPKHALAEDALRALRDMLVTLNERVAAGQSTEIIVSPDYDIYWLRPGESTVEMDARAEAIRAGKTA